MTANTLPETIMVKIYIQVSPHTDEPQAFTSDMSEYGYIPLGTDEVIVAVPQTDRVLAEIEMLEKAADKIKADTHAQVKTIEDRIQSLKALEYKPGDDDE